MPKIRETSQAFIVEPTLGEQVSRGLEASLPLIMRQFQRRTAEKREKETARRKFLFDYNKLHPAQQRSLNADPNFPSILKGLGFPALADATLPHRGWPGGTPHTPKAIRQYSTEEQLALDTAILTNQNAFRTGSKLAMELKTMAMELDTAQTAYDAGIRINTEDDPTKLKWSDFVLANPGMSNEELTTRFVIATNPNDEEELVSLVSGYGHHAQELRQTEMFNTLVKEGHEPSAMLLAYVQAVVTGNTDMLSTIVRETKGQSLLWSLSLKQHTELVNEHLQVASRFRTSERNTLVSQAQIFADKNNIPIAAATEVLGLLRAGKPLPLEFNLDDAEQKALLRDIQLHTAAKLRADLKYDAINTIFDVMGELRQLIDSKVATGDKMLPAELGLISTEGVRMVKEAFGITISADPDEDSWFWSLLHLGYSGARAGAGLAVETVGVGLGLMERPGGDLALPDSSEIRPAPGGGQERFGQSLRTDAAAMVELGRGARAGGRRLSDMAKPERDRLIMPLREFMENLRELRVEFAGKDTIAPAAPGSTDTSESLDPVAEGFRTDMAQETLEQADEMRKQGGTPDPVQKQKLYDMIKLLRDAEAGNNANLFTSTPSGDR
jgi:hypothetical protein